jgi:hypothetical protein
MLNMFRFQGPYREERQDHHLNIHEVGGNWLRNIIYEYGYFYLG